jgi:hypothetical protein
MKKLIFVIVFSLLFGQVFAQRVLWTRQIDYSGININREDALNDVHAFDTSTIFVNGNFGKYYDFLNPSLGYYPVVLKLNNRLDIVDTFVFPDTARRVLSCLSILKRRLWLVYEIGGLQPGLVFRKIDFNGNIRALRVLDYNTSSLADSVPRNMYKVLPAPDGGFFMLSDRNRTINNVRTVQWQISRYDSLGARKWLREYLYDFTIGTPDDCEILPNGRLFVSGSMGRNIVGLELDTATGNLIRRRTLFTNPNPNGWAVMAVKPLVDGYMIFGQDGSANSRRLFMKLSDSLTTVWGSANTTVACYGFRPMRDSSVWMVNEINNRNLHHIKLSPDSTVLVDIPLVFSADSNNTSVYIKSIIHFNDGSAIIGGDGERQENQRFNRDLYFCKIGGYGTPYNPVYPPVGPVLTSNQKQNQEPNLQVYPNPFTNTLRLSHKGTAQLLDVHGRVILSQPVEAGEELKVANLPKGMYLLRLQSVGGKMYVRKVVRE